MRHLIDKDDLVAIIKYHIKEETHGYFCKCLLSEIDEHLKVLEVKDTYEQCVQYDSIPFNTESKLFNQLTKERPELWRKEIEQVCISGKDTDVELVKFMGRYAYENGGEYPSAIDIANHFFELGINTRKG